MTSRSIPPSGSPNASARTWMSIGEGAAASPSATIKMKGEDYVKMVNGQLSGPMAFMKGQMKITGNMMLAQKMQQLFPPHK